MLLGLMVPFLGSGRGGVTLSGETISHDTSGGTAIAGIRFNTDGTVDRLLGSTYTQIDVGTDWIIPNNTAHGAYEVRVTNVVGDGYGVSAAAEDVWIDLSSDREWSLSDNDASENGDRLTTADFEIRLGGSTLASASYVLSADYEA